MFKRYKSTKGITLVALVITIVILLILAGISISTLTNTGLFGKAKEAKKKSDEASAKEQSLLYEYEDELSKYTSNDRWDGKVNKPELMTGMTAIQFTEPTADTAGSVKTVSDSSKNDWYNYNERKWANATTEDGSMWVWVPRYAYKINSSTHEISVVFLVGTTDNYYEGGTLKTAQRQTADGEAPDATKDYVVHPSFVNGTKNNYKNGEWSKELAGYWVAKFPAGYQKNTITNNNGTLSTTISNDSDEVKYSDKNYNDYDRNMTTNALSQSLSSKPKMSYPVFKPLTYAYNNISTGDAYTLSQEIKNGSSFYGLNAQNTDSHQMKNSEWGAVAYLSQSSYGRNGQEINLNNYYTTDTKPWKTAITGMCMDGTKEAGATHTLGNAYNTVIGVKGSSTGNMTGIYDLNGCVWERTAAYISNGNANISNCGSSYANTAKNADGYKTLSTKYVTVYPWDVSGDGENNNYTVYKNLKYGYGDAILETSSSGTDYNGWNTDYSSFARLDGPFFYRGGFYYNSSYAGVFAFGYSNGGPWYGNGFRSVLVAQ